MASYNRPASPGGRRIQNPGRTSDNLTDLSRERSNSYASPKSSGGVIPISSETFVNYPPSQQQRYDQYAPRISDAYANRPRQTSVGDPQRGAGSGPTQVSSRDRPKVIQTDVARPASPLKTSQNRDYYVTPSVSKEPRKETHKKVYSVNDGTANLVADVNVANTGERHHRRRESDSGERGGYIRPPTEKDRGRRGYHLSGAPGKRLEKSIEDEDAYSYTDARGMFNSTEPSWRDRDVPRPRRNSVDRGSRERPSMLDPSSGADVIPRPRRSSVDRGSRERPVSMLDPSTGVDTRRMSRDVRDIGPPPSTRGWDKVNEMARSRSVREPPRDNLQSPTRARPPLSPPDPRMPQSPTRGRYPDSRDPYYVPPRTSTNADDRRYLSVNPGYDQYDYRQPRIPERRNSTTRASDRSVERRGFGIRESSQDRYGRGSEEAFNQQNQNQYREADAGYGFPGPQRRETAPDMSRYDEQRLEQQEKRDREDREARERELRRREEEARNQKRDYESERPQRRERDDDHDIDRQRERERERMLQPQPEGERHHHRHGSYRGREYDRNDISPRGSGEALAQPGLSTAAAGGLAGAAAAYGVSSYQHRNEERDRERDRDLDRNRERDREREQDRRSDNSKENERERLSPRPPELRAPQDTRAQDTHSDDGMPSYQQERQRADDHDRGLGFAYEAPPEPPKSAPPMRDRHESVSSREGPARDLERTHEDPPNEKPSLTLDPDEDYRRRKEQVQRELGRVPDDKGSDSDPDRERRRREREQRLREREPRNGEGSLAGTNSTYSDTTASYQMPGSFDNESVEGTDSTAARTLRRKPSILDEPMDEPGAQIIDNSASERRENRVKIVDPPTEEEERRPRGILKKPKEKFPDYPDEVREGVAPLKDAKGSSSIPPGARWTKIDRRLVNPEALEDAKERFEERLDCVIVLRVLTKEDIQKLADRTKAIRDERYHNEKEERKAERRRNRHRDRQDRDEFEDDSEDEFKPRAPKMLEAPASSAGASSTGDQADFSREHRDRRRDRDGDREPQYASSGYGRRDEYEGR